MTIGEKLLNYFPANIKKSSEVYSSLVANEKKDGVFETELAEAKAYIESWYEIKNVYALTSDKLLKVTDFFSYLEKFTDETDKAFKNRFSAIFRRKGDTSWGSVINVKHVFEQYFNLADVYVVENTNNIEENLIENGDFENLESTDWIFNNAELSKNARFIKSQGACIQSNGSILQEIEVDSSKTYFLHFFCKGKGKVCFKNSQNKYWNPQKEIWQEENIYSEFTADDWKNVSFWFKSELDQESVIITIYGESILYVDYVRFFKKNPYPSFTVIVHFTGQSAGKPLALFKGNEDVPSEIYQNAFYYNNAFFTGTMSGFAIDIYEDLLKYLTSVGVKSRLEILTKDYIEGE